MHSESIQPTASLKRTNPNHNQLLQYLSQSSMSMNKSLVESSAPWQPIGSIVNSDAAAQSIRALQEKVQELTRENELLRIQEVQQSKALQTLELEKSDAVKILAESNQEKA